MDEAALPLRLALNQHALLAVLALGVAGGLAFLWLGDRIHALKARAVRVRVRK